MLSCKVDSPSLDGLRIRVSAACDDLSQATSNRGLPHVASGLGCWGITSVTQALSVALCGRGSSCASDFLGQSRRMRVLGVLAHSCLRLHTASQPCFNDLKMYCCWRVEANHFREVPLERDVMSKGAPCTSFDVEIVRGPVQHEGALIHAWAPICECPSQINHAHCRLSYWRCC